MADLDRLGLVVVKPDGVAQSRTAAVVDFLRQRGFRLLACRQLMLDPPRRAELYRTTRAGGRLDWELNGVLYALGPVHALLVDGPPGAGFDSAAHRLSAGLKGSFVPARAAAGTLRADLGALNPVFNLVHTTDATGDLDRETAALFDRPIREVVRELARDGRGTPGPLRAGGRPEGGGGLAGGWLPAPGHGPAAGGPAAGGGPFRLWSTVSTTLRSWLVRQAGPEAAAPLGEVGWPADSAGPGVPALRRAAEAWTGLLAAARPYVDQATLGRLAGVRTGAWSYPDFRATGAAPAWPAYLTYTTIRYLDLCLERGNAG